MSADKTKSKMLRDLWDDLLEPLGMHISYGTLESDQQVFSECQCGWHLRSLGKFDTSCQICFKSEAPDGHWTGQWSYPLCSHLESLAEMLRKNTESFLVFDPSDRIASRTVIKNPYLGCSLEELLVKRDLLKARDLVQ